MHLATQEAPAEMCAEETFMRDKYTHSVISVTTLLIVYSEWISFGVRVQNLSRDSRGGPWSPLGGLKVTP